MSTPYWGHLPGPRAGQTRARRLSDDQIPPPERRQSLDPPSQGQARSNRVSVQTTKSDAPTDSTMSPFASPTASSFQGQGLAPRPPSLPYGANQYPPELLENRRRRRSRNQEQNDEYVTVAGPAPPAAPDVPRAPPLSYKYPPVSGGATQYPNPVSPPGIGRPSKQMDSEEYYKAPTPASQKEDHPVLDRTRNTLDESAMPRPQRANTDPILGRDGSTSNDRQRRTSAAEQSLQRSSRRSSTHHSTDRPRFVAPDRSPLQKLEETFDKVSKEEKRARVEAAERAAQEKAARQKAAANGTVQQKEKSALAQQGRHRERRPSIAAGDAPVTPVTSTKSTQAPASQPSPISQRPPEEVLDYSAASGRSPKTAAPGSRIPVPSGQPSGIPQRNLSFREHAAMNEVKLPNSLSEVATKGTAAATMANGPAPSTSSSNNKLKKKPPNDPWPNRISESEEIYNSGETAGRSPKTALGTSVAPGVHGHGNSLEHVPFEPPDKERTVSDYYNLGDESPDFSPATKKLVKSPSQRKADQILGRAPTETTATNGAPGQHAAVSGTAGARMSSGPTVRAVPHVSPHRDERGGRETDEDRHHVSDLIYHARDKFQPGQGVFKPTPYLDEWKHGTVGSLSGALLDLDDVPPAVEKNTPWWEAPQSRRRSSSMSSRPKKAEAFEGEYDDTNGMSTPNPQAMYPNIGEIQSGDLHRLSGSDVDGGLPFEPQHLAPPSKRAKARARRWDALRTFSPSLSHASDSQDSLSRFMLSSNDALHRQPLPYSSPTRFKPPLYLKCGPLLRFCGIRHERVPSRSARNGAVVDREIWRGSIMIVTTDADSSYDIAPTLRLFVQPIELLPPPPREIQGDEPLAAEYVDPIAGHPKLGRKGETLYVRPVDHLDESKDLSRDETDDGLFEKSKSPPEVPLPAGVVDPPGSFAARRKRAEIDGEKAGKYRDVRGFRLHAERGYTFWRFNIEVELREKQQRIAYRINRGPSTGFWVPAKGQTMNIMFYSCNGFSMSVNSDLFSGPDPMWRDVLNTHQSQPFHVMIGGGDQIYNDRCMQDTKLFRDWLMIKNPLHKHNAPFTPEMQDELENFYLERYSMWFSQGLFSMANSQIPMVNMFDDHDIIDGFGSYPHHFMNSPVFSGLGNVAFKYYMLFQHQSVVEETEKTEPSWTLGVRPGPYINELSRSLFMFLGNKVALLAVDARTERTREEVVRQDTWTKIMDRCYGEIDKGKVEHLLVLLGVPVAYPRLVWLENILTSRVMDPIKALGKLGMFSGLLNRFDGGVEVLDDLDDHWTARNHKHERSTLVEDLQDLAADKSIRVTILSGDVHLAAIGQFYSNPKLGIAKHKDFRYIPNVISSAIVNAPPPDLMADILNKRNKVHHFDKETDEAMIPIFGHGVDGKPRNNKNLLPHRNWCAIREYVPGNTPPPTPDDSAYDVAALGSPQGYASAGGGLGRSLSGGLFRRLSRSGGKDRTHPPVSGGLLRSLSRRGGVASADEVGKPLPPKPGLLTRTMSGSSVSGRFGGLFRRRNSSAKRNDDGGINGQWGPDTEEEEEVEETPYAGRGHGRGVGLRGGMAAGTGTDYFDHAHEHDYGHNGGNHEYGRDDERFFSAVKRSQTTPAIPGGKNSAVMSGGIAAAVPPLPGLPPGGQGSEQDPAVGPPLKSFSFHRVPTGGLSAKQRKRGGAEAYAVDLRGALEVTLNVEISARDPGGSTVPYRLVVPRLWYEYEGEEAQQAAVAATGVVGTDRDADGDVDMMDMDMDMDMDDMPHDAGVEVGEKIAAFGGRGGGDVHVHEMGSGGKVSGIKRLISLRRGAKVG